jgi:hypothetical protein
MSTKLMIAMEDSVLMFESSNTGWKKVYESLKGTHPQCIAFDPNNPNRAYCGTFGGGLWKTDDSRGGWDNIGKEILSSKDVMYYYYHLELMYIKNCLTMLTVIPTDIGYGSAHSLIANVS